MSEKQVLSLADVLDSKTFVREGGVQYKAPKEYINPFLDVASKYTNDFTVNVIQGSINANDDGNFNRAYSRVMVEANLPKEKYSYIGETDKETLDAKVGFIYALDLQKPTIKIFAGRDVRACMNLTIFNPEHLFSQDLTSNLSSSYSRANEFFQTLDKDLEDFVRRMESLSKSNYSGSSLDELNGRMIRMALKNPKLGTTVIINGIKELYSDKSKYALKDSATTGWNYYNAITEHIKGADLLDKPTKTVILSEIIFNDEEN